jgi:hypothetical protein
VPSDRTRRNLKLLRKIMQIFTGMVRNFGCHIHPKSRCALSTAALRAQVSFGRVQHKNNLPSSESPTFSDIAVAFFA